MGRRFEDGMYAPNEHSGPVRETNMVRIPMEANASHEYL